MAVLWFVATVASYYEPSLYYGAGGALGIAALAGVLGVPVLAAWACWHACIGAWATRRHRAGPSSRYVVAAVLSAAVLVAYASPWNQPIVRWMLD